VYAFGLANPKGGFYAEYAAVKADEVSLIPEILPTDQAGALPWDAMTALRGLDDTLGLQAGESLRSSRPGHRARPSNSPSGWACACSR
jgi:NADPH:quinone reductase-like Zn-dependent oxidoreductase